MLNSTEFLFDIARNDFKKIILKDVENGNFENMPLFAQFNLKYVGTEPEKRTASDQAFRDLVGIYIKDTNTINDSNLIAKMLDVITASVAVAKQGLCSPSISIILLGDIFDCFTLDACDVVFQYIEDRVSIWKSPLFYTAGKNYLLRMCNDLLRRLSQSISTVFCGRIQLFLARLFPLSEKSALNLVSQFNLENITIYNKDPQNTTLSNSSIKDEPKSQDDDVIVIGDDCEKMEVDTNNTSTNYSDCIVDYKLYKSIWSLQDIFRYPVQCYTKSSWAMFVENADNLIRVFKSFKLDDMQGGHKIKTFQHNRAYFSKFLTSEKLTDLQLNDGLFRRQILTQFLILFRYLNAKVKFKGPNYVLNESQKKWIKETETKIYDLLKETPPNGKHFAKYIGHIVNREDYWIHWKNEGCPSFMKSRSAKSDEMEISEPSRKRKRSHIAEDFITGKPFGIGSPELTRLWNICSDNLAACKSTNREFVPSLHSFFMESVEQNDPKNEIEDQYKSIHNSNFQWKALRLLSSRSQLFFMSQPILMQFKNIPDYLNTTINKIAKDFPEVLVEVDAEEQNEEEEGTLSGEIPDGDLEEETSEVNENEDEEMLDESNELEEVEDSSLLDDENGLDQTSGIDLTKLNANRCLLKQSLSNATDLYSKLDLESTNLEKLTSNDITTYATKIAGEWVKLAPHLNIKAKAVDEIKKDSDNAVLQARQLLVTWQDLMGNLATWGKLSEALESCGLDNVANEI